MPEQRIASSKASMLGPISSVTESKQRSTLRLSQPTLTTAQTKPRAIAI